MKKKIDILGGSSGAHERAGKSPSGTGNPAVVVSLGDKPLADDGWVPVEIRKRLSLKEIREELSASSGPEYWQGLEQLANRDDFKELVESEFPKHHNAYAGVDRREFIKLAGASLALAGLSACTKQPIEKIVPYVKPPEEVIPGLPLFFATTMTLGGYGVGLLAESHTGRPTKLEGNPDHPASLGGTDIFGQAAILDLYDPDRSQKVRHIGRISTWNRFLGEIEKLLSKQAVREGAGIRILSGTQTSPTLAAQVKSLLEKYPKAKWVTYEPAGNENAAKGAQQAFGQDVETIYDFSKAEVVLSLESDFLYSGPGHVRYARDFAAKRKVDRRKPELNRMYAVESVPTVTGSNADHRKVLRPADLVDFAWALARELGARVAAGRSRADKKWVAAIAKDLQAHKGKSIVIAGAEQPPVVHALVHAINEALHNTGKTVKHIEPVALQPALSHDNLKTLVEEIGHEEVDLLVVLDSNPIYSAPADLDFEAAFLKVPARVHWGAYYDETARLCQWHIPAAHFLESWSDARAYDGTMSLVQPLIQPLYGGKSIHEMVGSMIGQGATPGHDIVKEQWEAYWKDNLASASFEKDWRKMLHDGVVDKTQAKARRAKVKPVELGGARVTNGKMDILFRADPSVLDGRFANNGWLQELPKPLSKIAWDNVVQISPVTAERLRLVSGDLVELRVGGGRTVRGPIWVTPGQADETVVLSLGFGRKHAGRVGNDVGFSAYAVRSAGHPWHQRGAVIEGPVGTYPLATTQEHHPIAWETAKRRHLVRNDTLAHYKEHQRFAQHPPGLHVPTDEETVYTSPYDYSKGEQWGMTINLSQCIGCNACVVACQSENNIPVVGKTEVARGREMQWIRVDRYYEGGMENPTVHNQPVNCMHCETAPCETVCPVGATVHSHDGLNQMVYNRCVGTRYCSNNCPYKVRRFNFFQYTDLKSPQQKLLNNPDVTVRVRGVMEKCTYCVQRISAARIDAKREGRDIRDGEVVTACQGACPANAIAFGNINDTKSAIARNKRDPLNYGLLEDLTTRPRTTYLAKVRNPNPELEPAKGNDYGKDDHHG